MLIKSEQVKNFATESTDGIRGLVIDIYFDDLFWNVQYLVIKKAGVPEDMFNLVPHSLLGNPDWEAQILPLHVSLKGHAEPGSTDSPKPVSKARENNAAKILEWPLSHMNLKSLNQDEMEVLVNNMPPDAQQIERKTDPHLRSRNEVLGYNIRAHNGEIGHVDDFILETETWKIRYLVVDTRNWLPGGKNVLISPAWIERIKWNNNMVYIDLRKEVIENSPSYDPDTTLNDHFELKLFKYYGRQRSQNKD